MLHDSLETLSFLRPKILVKCKWESPNRDAMKNVRLSTTFGVSYSVWSLDGFCERWMGSCHAVLNSYIDGWSRVTPISRFCIFGSSFMSLVWLKLVLKFYIQVQVLPFGWQTETVPILGWSGSHDPFLIYGDPIVALEWVKLGWLS